MSRAVRLSIAAMVRDELDVLPAFVAHHARLFDRMVIVDHRSVDGTREYLDRIAGFHDACEIEVLHYDQLAYHQSAISTALARREFRKGAEWVTVLDADEFLDVSDRAELIDQISSRGPVAVFSWLNLMPTDPPMDLEAIPPFRTDQEFVTLSGEWPPTRGKVMLHRDLARSHPRFVLPRGNHRVRPRHRGPKLPSLIAGRLLHVPARAPLQVLSKNRNVIEAIGNIGRWVQRGAREQQLQQARSVIASSSTSDIARLFETVVMHYESTSGIADRGVSVLTVRFPDVLVPQGLAARFSSGSHAMVHAPPAVETCALRRDQVWRASIRRSSVEVRRHPFGRVLDLRADVRAGVLSVVNSMRASAPMSLRTAIRLLRRSSR